MSCASPEVASLAIIDLRYSSTLCVTAPSPQTDPRTKEATNATEGTYPSFFSDGDGAHSNREQKGRTRGPSSDDTITTTLHTSCCPQK